jgi:hypothetical protein
LELEEKWEQLPKKERAISIVGDDINVSGLQTYFNRLSFWDHLRDRGLIRRDFVFTFLRGIRFFAFGALGLQNECSEFFKDVTTFLARSGKILGSIFGRSSLCGGISNFGYFSSSSFGCGCVNDPGRGGI